jgi:hypothetical protein
MLLMPLPAALVSRRTGCLLVVKDNAGRNWLTSFEDEPGRLLLLNNVVGCGPLGWVAP